MRVTVHYKLLTCGRQIKATSASHPLFVLVLLQYRGIGMSVSPVWNSRNRDAWMSAGSMHVWMLLCSEETETETETEFTETSDRDPCNDGASQSFGDLDCVRDLLLISMPQ